MVVHLPVVLCPVAAFLMLWALRYSQPLSLAYGFLVVTAATAIVAYYSGPSAFEELQLSAEKPWVEEHAVIGRAAFVLLILLAVLAIQGLLAHWQEEPSNRYLVTMILLGTLGACYLLAWTAHLGGQIRRPEIRSSPAGVVFPSLDSIEDRADSP